ncbi:stage 0 sporulation protein [Candidatus Aerophobetes bacterium]|nr:stage 0 sporulation protein [Candidatus Aerophobetes bacterium]
MPFLGVEIYNPKKVVYIFTQDQGFSSGEWCVFESQEGWEIGKVKFCVEKSCPIRGTKVRKATLSDLKEFKKREGIAQKAKKVATQKITQYGLPMKLISTKFPLEKKKIIFYYTAKERVDFRELVKDLAKIFKVRIQMQQIGVRDEPQILGGVGVCGREVCCASFLGKSKEKLESVALETARLQNLPLISSKISGICGRLRCCLNFEYDVYSSLCRQFPSIGEKIEVGGEKVKVVGYNVLAKTVIVENKEGIKKIININLLQKK